MRSVLLRGGLSALRPRARSIVATQDHHGRRSLTCGFSYLDHGWGAIGSRWGRHCLRAGALVDGLQPLGERVELVRVQVPVAVQGLHRVLVAELLLQRLDAGALA